MIAAIADNPLGALAVAVLCLALLALAGAEYGWDRPGRRR